MSFSKKMMAGILAVCMAVCLIAGMFSMFNTVANAQQDGTDKMTAVIDPAGTGFTEANAVPAWEDVFDWQWMGIGAGATITIKFTEAIDTAEYQYATFKALNWNTYAGNVIGERINELGLKDIIDSSDGKKLDVDYKLYVTSEKATMADNSVGTYVIGVLFVDYSEHIA